MTIQYTIQLSFQSGPSYLAQCTVVASKGPAGPAKGARQEEEVLFESAKIITLFTGTVTTHYIIICSKFEKDEFLVWF